MEYEFIDIRQRHYKEFLLALKRCQPEEWEHVEDLPMEVYLDILVRSAIEAGWFKTALSIDEIDEMDPKEVDKIAVAVAEVYMGIKAPDPN